MVLDLLVVVLIIVLAGALGIVVHPLFWLLLVIAAIWVLARGPRHRV